MPRLLLNLLSALSLLLALILMAFWVRSHWTADRLEYRTTSAADRWCREYILHSARGILVLTSRTSRLDRAEAYELFVREKHFGMSYYARRAYDPREWVGMYSVWNRLGFRAYASHDTGAVTRFRPNPRDMERVGNLAQQERGVYLPHWFVALILLAPGWPLVRRTTRFVTARLRPASDGVPVVRPRPARHAGALSRVRRDVRASDRRLAGGLVRRAALARLAAPGSRLSNWHLPDWTGPDSAGKGGP